MKVEIIAKFHVYVPGAAVDDKRVDYSRGQVIDDADLPAGQTAQDWIAKGLAKAVSTASSGDEPAREAGTAV